VVSMRAASSQSFGASSPVASLKFFFARRFVA